MNKFQKLTKKLINMPLWTTSITYIPRTMEKSGVNTTFTEQTPISLNIVLKSLDKSLIDNIKILPTDLSFVIDKLSVGNVTKDDIIIYNDKKYKIINIKELGVLNNEPVGYEIVIRLV